MVLFAQHSFIQCTNLWGLTEAISFAYNPHWPHANCFLAGHFKRVAHAQCYRQNCNLQEGVTISESKHVDYFGPHARESFSSLNGS